MEQSINKNSTETVNSDSDNLLIISVVIIFQEKSCNTAFLVPRSQSPPSPKYRNKFLVLLSTPNFFFYHGNFLESGQNFTLSHWHKDDRVCGVCLIYDPPFFTRHFLLPASDYLLISVSAVHDHMIQLNKYSCRLLQMILILLLLCMVILWFLI